MNEQTIEQGLKALCLIDKDLEAAVKIQGSPSPRVNPHGFEAFLSIIVSQQLSTKVASVIMGRLVALLEEVTPERLLSVEEQSLRNVGLSWRKIEYAKGLALAVQSGSLNINGLEALSDEDAIAAITSLKGFGRWSAEIYLMFSLGRQDIFPADDLGVLIALGRLKGLADKPTPKQAREMVGHWQPWRSVGSLFLWQYYHQDT
ncbi:DNA-3-methyladenine glycosylase family protein [Aliivibrio wodanis]|uniref:DNA-3-methyladenine glycosylase family protein n=1 Tax=Aliivibrio wodanis TaxID=80852 RepID=UPI00406C38C7